MTRGGGNDSISGTGGTTRQGDTGTARPGGTASIGRWLSALALGVVTACSPAAAAQKIGLDPTTDVKIVALGSGTNRSAALQSGAIQAEVDAPPTSIPLKAAGFKVLYNLAFADAIELLSQSNEKLIGFDPNTVIDNSFVQSAVDRGITHP